YPTDRAAFQTRPDRALCRASTGTSPDRFRTRLQQRLDRSTHAKSPLRVAGSRARRGQGVLLGAHPAQSQDRPIPILFPALSRVLRPHPSPSREGSYVQAFSSAKSPPAQSARIARRGEAARSERAEPPQEDISSPVEFARRSLARQPAV